MIDKYIAKKRYDDAAELFLKDKKFNKVVTISKYLHAPHEFCFEIIKLINKQSKILEIRWVTDINTSPLIKIFYNVCATDITLKSVELLKDSK